MPWDFGSCSAKRQLSSIWKTPPIGPYTSDNGYKSLRWKSTWMSRTPISLSVIYMRHQTVWAEAVILCGNGGCSFLPCGFVGCSLYGGAEDTAGKWKPGATCCKCLGCRVGQLNILRSEKQILGRRIPVLASDNHCLKEWKAASSEKQRAADSSAALCAPGVRAGRQCPAALPLDLGQDALGNGAMVSQGDAVFYLIPLGAECRSRTAEDECGAPHHSQALHSSRARRRAPHFPSLCGQEGP